MTGKVSEIKYCQKVKYHERTESKIDIPMIQQKYVQKMIMLKKQTWKQLHQVTRRKQIQDYTYSL